MVANPFAVIEALQSAKDVEERLHTLSLSSASLNGLVDLDAGAVAVADVFELDSDMMSSQDARLVWDS